MSVHFSSKTCEWSTPQDLFNDLNSVFEFRTDLCATPENAKCEDYFTKRDNGLARLWSGSCWLNPPYGREIGAWVRKAAESAIDGWATVVCLLPARTDTAWWHDYVIPFGEITFLRGRLRFGGAKNSAPFPSAIVVFRPRWTQPQKARRG